MITRQQYALMMVRTLARTPDEVKRVCRIENAVKHEKDLHKQIEDYCKDRSWFYVHSRFDKPTTTACGVVDFIVATHDGRTIYAEAKRRGGKCTPAQNAVLHWLKRNHQIAGVVTSLEEFKQLAGA